MPGSRATTPNIGVLIVDDHALVRKGLRELIELEPGLSVCGEAGDVPEALDLIESTHPGLMVVDLSLKEGHGLELIKQVKARHPQILVLVLTMHDERLYAERALATGARGFLNKQEPAERVVQAIRRILAGGVYLSQTGTDQVLGRFVGKSAPGEGATGPRLSDRELEVLEMLGQGISTADIAKQLHLSPKTVEAHRENLKRKLGLRNATELLRYAIAASLEQTRPEPTE
jgi:DNA-binding NarL/FixJ family response regulator